MTRPLYTLAMLALLLLSPRIAEAFPHFCIPANATASFQVNFNATNENSVRILRLRANQVVGMFNNFVGRGAGPEWTQSGGFVNIAPQPVQFCYRVEGRNKAGGPSGSLPWRDSAFITRPEGGGVDFEDGTDGDFNDAIVDVSVRGSGSFTGRRLCAPQGATMWINVGFFFTPETRIYITRERDLAILRTYASNLMPGTRNGNIFGAGTYTSNPADGPCFIVSAQNRTGSGTYDWINTPWRSDTNRMLFDPNRDGQFGEAKVDVNYYLLPRGQ